MPHSASVVPIRQLSQENLGPNTSLNMISQQQQQQQPQQQDDSQSIQQQLLIRIIKFNKFLKGTQHCQLFIVSLNLLLVSILALVFQSIDALKFPNAHAFIILFQIIVLVLHIGSFSLLKLNGKLLDDTSKRKTCKIQIKIYLCIFIIISIAGAFLLTKMISDVVTLQSFKPQSDTVDYDWILLSIDFLFSIIGLQIISVLPLIFMVGLLIFYIILTCIHIPVWACSKRKISLLTKFQNHMYKKLTTIISKRLKKLAKFQKIIDLNKTQDRTNFQSETCSICLEPFHDKQIIYELPCMSQNPKHNFHSACLSKWVIKQNSCPYCRTSFKDLFKQK